MSAEIVLPAPRENPKCLACDTDALIQILISNLLQPIRELKRSYAVQPVITPEVEIELRSVTKYAKRIDAPLTKALKNGVIRVLSQHVLREIYPSAADALYPAIQSLGARYRIVGAGEAYSHATAVTLQIPVLSNDQMALGLLTQRGFAVGVPTLSAFDLVLFGYQIGCLREADCDSFKYQMLERERNEFIPREFRHSSVNDGLRKFVPRLLDGDLDPIGAASSPGRPPHESQLRIYKSPRPALGS